MFQRMQSDLNSVEGFTPVVIENGDDDTDASSMHDLIGVVTVLDGPSLPNGEIIAPIVGDGKNDPNYHSNFQDPRGSSLQAATRADSWVLSRARTYASTACSRASSTSPDGHPRGLRGRHRLVHGQQGLDDDRRRLQARRARRQRLQGRLGDPCHAGQVRAQPLRSTASSCPPRTSFSSGRARRSATIISTRTSPASTSSPRTPSSPCCASVVLHIDYLQAPKVIQRFGDMEKLVNETLDPLISSYFRTSARPRP